MCKWESRRNDFRYAESLTRVNGGLVNADHGASDASTPHVLSSHVPREQLEIPHMSRPLKDKDR
jgi:hypothetical protein